MFGWLHRDILPLRYLNILFVPAAALAGGLVYAVSGHWLLAIGVNLMMLGLFWICVPPAVVISGWICNFLGMPNPPAQY